MHHWIALALITYTTGLGIWNTGVWEERDRLREENRRLRRDLQFRQPWRRWTKAHRKAS